MGAPNWIDVFLVYMDRPLWFNNPTVPSERLILARRRMQAAGRWTV